MRPGVLFCLALSISLACVKAEGGVHGTSARASLASFERLQMGMSYERAIEVLGGPGREMSRSEIMGTTSVMYAWDGERLGANMVAMFQNGRLISKSQVLLK